MDVKSDDDVEGGVADDNDGVDDIEDGVVVVKRDDDVEGGVEDETSDGVETGSMSMSAMFYRTN